MKLIVICAWCGKFIRFKDAPGDEPPKLPISHSICPECALNLEEETAQLTEKHRRINRKIKGGDHERQRETGIG